MPRILQVTHALYPQALGGVELYAWECAQALEAAVFSLTPARGSYPEWAGLQVIAPQPGENTRAAWRRALETARPEVVLVQHLGAASPELLETLTEFDIPYAVFIHDYTQLCPTHKLWHRRDAACTGPGMTGFKCAWCVSGTLRRMIEIPARTWRYQHRPEQWRNALARAAALVVETRYLRDFWIEQGAPPERIVVLPVRLPDTHPAPAVLEQRPPRSLFYGGGWGVAKGAVLLAEALDRIPAPVRLEVAGQWDEAAMHGFRAVVAPRHDIVCHGLLRPQAMQAALAGCTAAVVPSRWHEAYGRIAAEAQQLGMPVAATAVGGLPERIIHGVNGFLATPDDAGSLAEAIEAALGASEATGWNAAEVRRNATAEADDALARLRRLIELLADSQNQSNAGSGTEPALLLEHAGMYAAHGGALVRALRAEGMEDTSESADIAPELRRYAATPTRLRRVQLNHAIAWFRAAGCGRIVHQPADEDALTWFECWGLETADASTAEGVFFICEAGDDPPTADAVASRFPRARALAWIQGGTLSVTTI